MNDINTVPKLAAKAKADGLPISEYTIRKLIKQGTIPARYIGKKPVASYTALVRYFSCEDGCDNAPATVVAAPGLCRIEV
ncbi:MAG: hypothetical protein IJA47_04665 [Oscillospiraceae bacterium]|nr:hypothetical protein [Oscillospiraceae bacterium]